MANRCSTKGFGDLARKPATSSVPFSDNCQVQQSQHFRGFGIRHGMVLRCICLDDFTDTLGEHRKMRVFVRPPGIEDLVENGDQPFVFAHGPGSREHPHPGGNSMFPLTAIRSAKQFRARAAVDDPATDLGEARCIRHRSEAPGQLFRRCRIELVFGLTAKQFALLGQTLVDAPLDALLDAPARRPARCPAQCPAATIPLPIASPVPPTTPSCSPVLVLPAAISPPPGQPPNLGTSLVSWTPATPGSSQRRYRPWQRPLPSAAIPTDPACAGRSLPATPRRPTLKSSKRCCATADGVVPGAARQATGSCMAAAASTPHCPTMRFPWRLLAPSRAANRSGPLWTADAIRHPRPILPAVSVRHGPCLHSVERGTPCFDLRLIGTPPATPANDPIRLRSPRAIQHRRGAVGCRRRPNWRTALAKSGSSATSLPVRRSPAADVPPEWAGQTAASMLRRSPWWEDGRNTAFRGTGDWLMIA